MTRAWLVVLPLLACSRSPEGGRGHRGTPAGSGAVPEHVPLAVPTITTMSVHDLVAQASGGGSAWSLRHVRVRGVLDAIERDGAGCTIAVTLRDDGGAASVRCELVDPEPVPLHAVTTVDGQVDLGGSAPSLVHSRVLASPNGSAALEPACADPAGSTGSAGSAGSAAP